MIFRKFYELMLQESFRKPTKGMEKGPEAYAEMARELQVAQRFLFTRRAAALLPSLEDTPVDRLRFAAPKCWFDLPTDAEGNSFALLWISEDENPRSGILYVVQYTTEEGKWPKVIPFVLDLDKDSTSSQARWLKACVALVYTPGSRMTFNAFETLNKERQKAGKYPLFSYTLVDFPVDAGS